MASSGYDTSPAPLPGSSTLRRSSGSISYDMSPNVPARRRSPSPALSARRTSAPYDNYVPSRSGPSFRDEFPNANNYRPDANGRRPPPVRSSYNNRSPSPNRYEHSRGSEPVWHPSRISAPGSWQPSASSWSRPLAPTSPRDRPSRDTMAQSMSSSYFEPSDTWKKTHNRNEISPSSPANRFSAPRSSFQRRPISPRNDYAPPYYAPENSYRPSPVAPTYSHSGSRANNYRPQYDENTFRSQSFSSRNASRDTYNSYSPDPLLRGRPLRRPSWDSQHRGSRSRSRSISRRSSPNASSSKAMSTASRGNRGVPRRVYSRSRSRSLSHPRSRSRSRSLSSSDVASTRASERSSRDLPQKPLQQLPQHTLSSKYPLDVPPTQEPPVEPAIPLPSRPAPVAQQSTPPEKPETSALKTRLPTISTSVSAKQDVQKGGTIDQAGLSLASRTQQHTPISSTFSTPKLTIETNLADKTVSSRTKLVSTATSTHKELVPPSAKPHSSEVSKVAPTGKTSRSSPQSTASSGVEPSGKSTPAPKVAVHNVSLTAIGGRQGKEATVNFSSPLTSPDRSLKLEVDLTKRENGAVETCPSTAKFMDISDMTTDDDENLPNLSDAKSIADALRIVVMTRLRCDRQTREERINPVLMANHSIVRNTPFRPPTSPDALLHEMTKGKRRESRMEAFVTTKPSLVTRFAKRQEALSEKTERLREEYLALHERWQTHCAKLDNKSKKTNKDIPAAAEEVIVPASSGRSTRRTAAMLGDAVRSDLEMEQIIASLGVEELTDPNHLALRNLANIPDMISVSHGEVNYVFDDTNNLVDNPIEFFDNSKGIDVWTDEEKEIFLEQFAANPKQFGIIASFLPAKTAAQCVTYYYLHKKKHIDFRKITSLYAPGKRRRGGRRADKQKGNALMADIRQHDDEVSLSHSGPTTRRKRGILPAATKPAASRLGARLELTPTSTPTPDPEPEVRKRGRRPNSSARIVSALVDDVDNDNVVLEPKHVKKGRKVGRKPKTPALVPEDPPTPSSMDGNLNDSTTRRKTAAVNVQWSEDDKRQFLILLSQHGADFKRIAASMPNKTTIQVNNFYKGNASELDLEKVAASAPKRSPTPEAVTAGRRGSKYPGSGVMSPVAGPAEIVTEGLSHMDIDHHVPLNGHGSLQKGRDLLGDQSSLSTFASGSSGDLSGNSDRRSGLTEPAQQLVNMSNDSAQLLQHHSQKQFHFSRFVPNEESAPVNSLPLNHQYPTPPASAMPPSSTGLYSNFQASHYPNHEARVASRHGPLVFREHSSTSRTTPGRIAGGHNSYQSPLQSPSSGSLAHATAFPANRIPSWNRPPPASGSTENYSISQFYPDHR